MSTTVRVEGDLTADQIGRLRSRIEDALSGAGARGDIVIDVSAARAIDGGGMGALVHIFKRVRAAGGALRVANARGAVLETLQRVGVDAIFAVHETQAAPRPQLATRIIRAARATPLRAERQRAS